MKNNLIKLHFPPDVILKYTRGLVDAQPDGAQRAMAEDLLTLAELAASTLQPKATDLPKKKR